MATVNQSSGRRVISMPKTARNVKAALAQGEKAPAQEIVAEEAQPSKAELRAQERASKATEKVWINTLKTAAAFHRDALVVEMTVGLAVFVARADAEKVTLEAKRALNAVYAQAGYSCASPTEEHYKTVNRRINVAADLFVKLGGRAELADLMGDGPIDEQMDRLEGLVKSLKLGSVNAILEFVGKPVAIKRPRNHGAPVEGQQATASAPAEDSAVGKSTISNAAADVGQMSEADRRVAASVSSAIDERKAQEEPLPPGRIIQAGALHVAIPMTATYEDCMEAAEKLMSFAKSFLVPAHTAAVVAQAA
jgi:hypothetical protein